MAEFVDVAVEGDLALLVEAPPTAEPALVEAGRARDLSEQTLRSFAETTESIREAAAALYRRACDTPRPPDQVTVEFSVQLAAEAGVVVASTAAAANMKVAFTWTRDDR